MKQFTCILLLFLLINCKDQTENFYAIKEAKTNEIASNQGKTLMEAQCYVCHSPEASHENRLAPPMMAVKKHYLDSETTKEKFTEEIWVWIQNPNEEDAKMHGAVRKFGVMPKQAFSEDDVKQIASYMFENELEHLGKRQHGKGKHQKRGL